MNLLQRIVNIFSAKASVAVNNAESKNTHALTEQALQKARTEIQEAEASVGRIEGRLILQESDVETLQADVTKWENYLLDNEASLETDPVLIKQINSKLNQAEIKLTQSKMHLAAIQEGVDGATTALQVAQQNYDKMSLKAIGAQVQSEIADALDATARINTRGGQGAASEIDRLATDTSKRLAEAKGHQRVEARTAGTDLEERLQSHSAETPQAKIARLRASRAGAPQ